MRKKRTDYLSESINISFETAKASFSSNVNKISIITSKERAINVPIKMRRTSYQARLGSKLDTIIRRVSDNGIRLTSNPTDMIRVSSTRDPLSQDLISRKVESIEVVPIILPVLKDFPMRRFIREGNEDVLIPSLYPIQDQEYFEIYSPLEVQLNEDDLLIRIIHDNYSETPYVMCLQVKEILATLSYSSITSHKFYVTFYDEKLPKEVIEYIRKAIDKRLFLQY